MHLNIVFLAFFLVCVQTTISSSLPLPKKCQSSDSTCIKSSAQDFIPFFAAGIPELGVEKMDPMFVKHLDGSSPSLMLSLNDVTVTGLSQCQAKKFQLNSDKTKLSVKILCTVDGEGQYDLKGQLLVFPIEGKGKIHVIIRKIQISVEANLKEVQGSDGLPHWDVGQWDHSYVLKEKATLELENLFNGNESLGRVIRELLQSSPNEVVNEVAPPVVKAIGVKIIENVKKMFEKVPLTDLIE